MGRWEWEHNAGCDCLSSATSAAAGDGCFVPPTGLITQRAQQPLFHRVTHTIYYILPHAKRWWRTTTNNQVSRQASRA